MTGEWVRRIAEDHLADLREWGGAALRVVDKTPTNFWHLGPIAILFPRARVIHCRFWTFSTKNWLATRNKRAAG
jgi:hypothetical protein